MNPLEHLHAAPVLSNLFIGHIMRARRIPVMYLGQLVELAAATELCAHPLQPYTNGLLAAHGLQIAVLSAHRDDRQELSNTREVPSALAPSGSGCQTRCLCATTRCAKKVPIRKEVAASHSVTCHHYD